MKTKCPYDCKCTRKIKDYCCADKGFVCSAKQKEIEKIKKELDK